MAKVRKYTVTINYNEGSSQELEFSLPYTPDTYRVNFLNDGKIIDGGALDVVVDGYEHEHTVNIADERGKSYELKFTTPAVTHTLSFDDSIINWDYIETITVYYAEPNSNTKEIEIDSAEYSTGAIWKATYPYRTHVSLSIKLKDNCSIVTNPQGASITDGSTNQYNFVVGYLTSDVEISGIKYDLKSYTVNFAQANADSYYGSWSVKSIEVYATSTWTKESNKVTITCDSGLAVGTKEYIISYIPYITTVSWQKESSEYGDWVIITDTSGSTDATVLFDYSITSSSATGTITGNTTFYGSAAWKYPLFTITEVGIQGTDSTKEGRYMANLELADGTEIGTFRSSTHSAEYYYVGSITTTESYSGNARNLVFTPVVKRQGHTYYVYYRRGTASSDANLPATQSRVYPNAVTLATNSMTARGSTVATYTVTYNYNGSGASNTTATADKYSDYSADGWYDHYWTGSSYVARYHANGEVYGANLTDDSTLYPYFKVTYRTNSVILPTPTRSGYIFSGWSTLSDAASGTYPGGYIFTPPNDTTLYAIWTKTLNEPNITITYFTNTKKVVVTLKNTNNVTVYYDLGLQYEYAGVYVTPAAWEGDLAANSSITKTYTCSSFSLDAVDCVFKYNSISSYKQVLYKDFKLLEEEEESSTTTTS